MVDFRSCDKYDPLVTLTRALYICEREAKLRDALDRFGDCESIATFCCTGVSISFHVGKIKLTVCDIRAHVSALEDRLERSLFDSYCAVL